MKIKLVLCNLFLCFILFNCNNSDSDLITFEDNFEYSLDEFSDIKVLRYDIPGWKNLTLKEQKLVYYLTQAGLSGRDIMWDQNYRHNLDIRIALENVFRNYAGDKSSSEWLSFEVYLKRLWFSNGIHHHYSNAKIKPEFNSDFLSNLLSDTNTILSDEAVDVIFNDSNFIGLIGMIIGSIYYIGKDFGEWNRTNLFSLILGVAVGLGVSFLTPAGENDNLWFVFVCGIIGVSGMTLPGLSGSFILILMGNYVLLLVDSVNALFFVATELLVGNFEVLAVPEKIRYLKIISVFTAGSIFGLVAISHVLGYVLKRFNAIVTAVIIGFITGSLVIVWPWKQALYTAEKGVFVLDNSGHKIIENYQRFVPDFSFPETWFAVLYIILGLSLILIIDFYGRKNK
jgi:uncharacterized membrane protein